MQLYVRKHPADTVISLLDIHNLDIHNIYIHNIDTHYLGLQVNFQDMLKSYDQVYITNNR